MLWGRYRFLTAAFAALTAAPSLLPRFNIELATFDHWRLAVGLFAALVNFFALLDFHGIRITPLLLCQTSL
jgi:hypothetical protein